MNDLADQSNLDREISNEGYYSIFEEKILFKLFHFNVVRKGEEALLSLSNQDL